MTKPIKVWILPYTLAREFIPEEPTLAIRIFDPGETRKSENVRVTLSQSSLWIGEVHSTFADLDPYIYEGNGMEDLAKQVRASPLLFTDYHARDILLQIQLIRPKLPFSLMVHCNAGLSRSPAIARSVCEIFDLTPVWMGNRETMMNKGHIGNKWVYQKMREVAGLSLPVSQDDVSSSSST